MTQHNPTPDYGPPDVCALIIHRLHGTPTGQGGAIYTYGSKPTDTQLEPPPDHTTILITTDNRPRWFNIEVREIDPHDPTHTYRLDHDLLTNLARRAGLPPPPQPW